MKGHFLRGRCPDYIPTAAFPQATDFLQLGPSFQLLPSSNFTNLIIPHFSIFTFKKEHAFLPAPTNLILLWASMSFTCLLHLSLNQLRLGCRATSLVRMSIPRVLDSCSPSPRKQCGPHHSHIKETLRNMVT